MRTVFQSIVEERIRRRRVYTTLVSPISGAITNLRIESDTVSASDCPFDIKLNDVSLFPDAGTRPTILQGETFVDLDDLSFEVSEGDKLEFIAYPVGPNVGIGNRLYTVITFDDMQSEQGPEGPQGPQGDQGPQGEQGYPGIVPFGDLDVSDAYQDEDLFLWHTPISEEGYATAQIDFPNTGSYFPSGRVYVGENFGLNFSLFSNLSDVVDVFNTGELSPVYASLLTSSSIRITARVPGTAGNLSLVSTNPEDIVLTPSDFMVGGVDADPGIAKLGTIGSIKYGHGFDPNRYDSVIRNVLPDYAQDFSDNAAPSGWDAFSAELVSDVYEPNVDFTQQMALMSLTKTGSTHNKFNFVKKGAINIPLTQNKETVIVVAKINPFVLTNRAHYGLFFSLYAPELPEAYQLRSFWAGVMATNKGANLSIYRVERSRFEPAETIGYQDIFPFSGYPKYFKLKITRDSSGIYTMGLSVASDDLVWLGPDAHHGKNSLISYAFDFESNLPNEAQLIEIGAGLYSTENDCDIVAGLDWIAVYGPNGQEGTDWFPIPVGG